MTKKFICPKCKTQLEYVNEHANEYRVYSWIIYPGYDEAYIDTDVCYESNTEFFECPKCNYEGQALEEFVDATSAGGD